jgi:hypothetical protein
MVLAVLQGDEGRFILSGARDREANLLMMIPVES